MSDDYYYNKHDRYYQSYTVEVHASTKAKKISSGSRTRARLAIVYTTCIWCKGPFTFVDPPTIEHLVPKSAGGSNKWHNLAAAHESCNGYRSNDPQLKRVAEWKATLQRDPPKQYLKNIT